MKSAFKLATLIMIMTVSVIRSEEPPAARGYEFAASKMQHDAMMQQVMANERFQLRQVASDQILGQQRSDELRAFSERRFQVAAHAGRLMAQQQIFAQNAAELRESAANDRVALQWLTRSTALGLNQMQKSMQAMMHRNDASFSANHEPGDGSVTSSMTQQNDSPHTSQASTKARSTDFKRLNAPRPRSEKLQSPKGPAGESSLAASTFASRTNTDRCRDLFQQIDEALYRDKRASTPHGGTHGLWHRLKEQVGGKNGPGTSEWEGHEIAFENDQQHLRRLLHEFSENGCGTPPRIAWQLATRPAPKSTEWRGPASTASSEYESMACPTIATLVAVPAAVTACLSEGSVSLGACSSFGAIPAIPLGCGIAGCLRAATFAGVGAYLSVNSACSHMIE